MITSAFLLKVVVYGLMASLVIPVIDFLIVIIRESRKPNRLDENLSTLNEWHPSEAGREAYTLDVAGHTQRRSEPAARGREFAARETEIGVREKQVVMRRVEETVVTPAGRFVKQNGTVAYMASNGVTITPGIRETPRPNHPHSEYWEYGNVTFYDAR